ncbi:MULTISPECIES: MFS transporter [Streptomyces]|uniref:MFS transporter n=1 Tax=Streptomyces lycopersici TaxID=2974589 RepID=UPI0021CF9E5F|nr:MFS transporter [Streptomyces sp. NEAU-383]
MPIQSAAPAPPSSPPRRELRKVLWASWLGTSIEYYDFTLYTAMATLVLGPLFFNDLAPAVATIASLGVLAVGYVVRPLGAMIFGHVGDRFGRKTALVWTMIVMGGSSTLIGLLPTPQQIGQWAPVLLILLRVVQGIGVGGEWGGGALMAYEHADKTRRGFAGSVVNAGTPMGVLLSSGCLALFLTLPDSQFNSWGWRVPFLLSALLIAFALWLRLHVSESPAFAREVDTQAPAAHNRRLPLLRVLRHPRGVIVTLALSVFLFVDIALVNSFGLLWIVEAGQLPRSDALLAQTIAALVNVPCALFFGWLSDRIDRKLVVGTGLIGGALYSLPFLQLLQTGNLALTIAGYIAAIIFMSAVGGPISVLLSDQFDATSRYTGVSLGYQLAATIGGVAPLAFSGILAADTNTAAWWISAIVIGIGALSTAALRLSRTPINASGTPSVTPTPPPTTERVTETRHS